MSILCPNCGSKIEKNWIVCQSCGINLNQWKHSKMGKKKIQKVKYDDIAKYYDLESLTQEKVDSELTRLHEEIEKVEKTLIHLEQYNRNNPDIFKFYEKRDKIRDQLDAIYVYLAELEWKRHEDFLKNAELRGIYGRLPEWRIEELKEKRDRKNYYLRTNIR